jgi:hypothetical protein
LKGQSHKEWTSKTAILKEVYHEGGRGQKWYQSTGFPLKCPLGRF